MFEKYVFVTVVGCILFSEVKAGGLGEVKMGKAEIVEAVEMEEGKYGFVNMKYSIFAGVNKS